MARKMVTRGERKAPVNILFNSTAYLARRRARKAKELARIGWYPARRKTFYERLLERLRRMWGSSRRAMATIRGIVPVYKEQGIA